MAHPSPLFARRDGVPRCCVPIVAPDVTTILAQAAQIRQHDPAPDLVEWRVDAFSAAPTEILGTLWQLSDALGPQLPLLFTNRRADEGGMGNWSEADRLASIDMAIASGLVALIDIELATPTEDRQRLMQAAASLGVTTIVSSHDFAATPADAELDARFAALSATGATIPKLAVTAETPSDVLRLLAASARAAERTPQPLIALAMGPVGTFTRLAGPFFGVAFTFATIDALSAPGQLPIALVRDYWQSAGLRER